MALLDQNVAAGIGNVYKSEVCWIERVSPFAPSIPSTTTLGTGCSPPPIDSCARISGRAAESPTRAASRSTATRVDPAIAAASGSAAPAPPTPNGSRSGARGANPIGPRDRPARDATVLRVRFENTDDLQGAEFVNVDLTDARFQNVNLTGARFREAQLVNARFSGLIDGLVVNDVEVGPLIHAEMLRRYPERAKLLPADAAGVREAWAVIESLWAATKARVTTLPEPLLHERVDGEWSLLETLRHLIMVTDAWISGAVLGLTGHFSSIGVVPTFMTDPESFGIDPQADPPLDDVIAVREGRMDVVRDLVVDLSDRDLQREVPRPDRADVSLDAVRRGMGPQLVHESRPRHIDSE